MSQIFMQRQLSLFNKIDQKSRQSQAARCACGNSTKPTTPAVLPVCPRNFVITMTNALVFAATRVVGKNNTALS